MNKGQFQKRVRDGRNNWLAEYPKSWRPKLLRTCRRRLTRMLERIEKIENQ